MGHNPFRIETVDVSKIRRCLLDESLGDASLDDERLIYARHKSFERIFSAHPDGDILDQVTIKGKHGDAIHIKGTAVFGFAAGGEARSYTPVIGVNHMGEVAMKRLIDF
tara:strand:- start:1811 stop:2137 length:327 start_codon:yes stop_codon:yes gene_type:complete